MALQINRSWRISTTPSTTKFFLIIFKLTQQSIMVILSCLVKKNQNLNSRKNSSVYYWKLRFPARNTHKPHFSVIKWTFFPQFQISIILREAIQIRLLYKFENDQKKFGCVGSCGYAPASVNYKPLLACFCAIVYLSTQNLSWFDTCLSQNVHLLLTKKDSKSEYIIFFVPKNRHNIL